MFMGADAPVFGNEMDIEIEGNRTDRCQLDQAGFLLNLPPGDGLDGGTSVGVSAGLKPAVEFSVMNQDHLRAGRIDHPGGGRDMADGERAFEAVRMAGYEFNEPRPGLFIIDVDGSVGADEIEKGHGWMGKVM